MKTSLIILASGLLLSSGQLHAQYRIDWHQIGSGGGQATGNVYVVSGTIGQPGAGAATGGSFGLVGGFWAFIGTVPTPGAPRLNIERAGDGVRVFWLAAGSSDFVLQETDTLDTYPTLEWQDASYPYTTNGPWISVTIPLQNGSARVGPHSVKIPAKKVVKFRHR